MSTDISGLTALLYRADWTALSLSATVVFDRDPEIERRLFTEQMEQMRPPPGMFGHRPPHHPVEFDVDADEADAEDEEDEDDQSAGRHLLIAPGGRYRITAADGRVLAVSDGSTRWLCLRDKAIADSSTGEPASDLHGLLTPRWLLSGYELEVTGEQRHYGRPAVAVRATRRGRWPGHRLRRYDLLDRVDVLVDAELGILLSSEQIFQGHRCQAAELKDLVLDPAEAADDSVFTLPPDLQVSNDDEGTGWQPSGPGWKLAGSAAGAAASALGFAIRHAPRKPTQWPTGNEPDMPAEPLPDDDGHAATGAGPVDADVVNMLHRTGLPTLNISCELHEWLDPAAIAGRFSKLQDKLPEPLTGIFGPDAMWQAVADRAEEAGITYRVSKLRAVAPRCYRIDRLSGFKKGSYLAIANDGEHTTMLFADRVAVMPPKEPSREIRGMLDPAWLLRNWRLEQAGQVEVGGRTGIRLLAQLDERPPSTPYTRFDLVVDTELGLLLRSVTYLAERPVSCAELRSLALLDDTAPADFSIEPGPGMRTVRSATLAGHVDLDRPAEVVGTAAKLAVGGAIAAGVAVTGWLDRHRKRQDRD